MGVILSDQPATEDLFNRKPFASHVAKVILGRDGADPLVVGIYGPWGDGKSTVLSFIEAELAKAPDCVVVRFNPWRFKNEDDLLVGFFSTLASALDRSLKGAGATIGTAFLKYARYFRPVTGVASVFGYDAADHLDKLHEHLAELDLEGDKQKVNDIIVASGKRIVVTMDDIDRLDQAEIRAIFKMVKLTADFKNTLYVLAFDDSVVASALGASYARGSDF